MTAALNLFELLHDRTRDHDFADPEVAQDRFVNIALFVERDRYLLNDKAMKGVGLYSGKDCVGYFYFNTGGHIGPLAVARPEALGSAFTSALALSVEIGSPQVSAFFLARAKRL